MARLVLQWGYMTTAIESVTDRIARMALADISEKRLADLTIAHPLVDDATFAKISDAPRYSKTDTVIIPMHKLATLSRGKGWARLGQGKNVTWGERCNGGYRVGPGHWTVGGDDGFSRKGQIEWTVEHVTVGSETWTVAS